MRKITQFFTFIIVTLILKSCAIQVPPTGGEKDVLEPMVLTMEPDNESLNFNEKKIEIEFDEFFRLNNIRDKFISSPPLDYFPTFSVKGKKLLIEIEDTLKENATYLFNFGDAIADIRENNSIKEFQYVFSTGNSIDSLKLSGIIKDSFTKEAVEGITVGLYQPNDSLDSIPYKNKPIFLTKTDKYGYFNLKYLSEGDYYLFAIKDENDNFLFDRPDEQIAFEEELIALRSNRDSIVLEAFVEDNEKQFVKEQKEIGPYTQLIFNLPMDTFKYTLLEKPIDEYIITQKINPSNDTIDIWWKQQSKERVLLSYNIGDDSDTLRVLIDSIDRMKVGEDLKGKIKSPLNYFSNLKIAYSYPLASFDTSLINLFNEDSIEITYKARITDDSKYLELDFDVQEDANYFISMLPNSVTDIYGSSNDTLQQRLKVNKESDFGVLEIEVLDELKENRILQLLDKSNNVLKEFILDDSSAEFRNLKPGVYQLRLIYDDNEDGRWTTGKYLENRQAEKVVLFEESIVVRANWDKEIKWVIK